MTTFLIIGAVGLGLLLVSLVIGDLLDGFLGGALDADWFSTAAAKASRCGWTAS